MFLGILDKVKSIFIYFILVVVILVTIFFAYKNWSQSKEIKKLRSDLYRIRVLNANAVLVAAQKFKFDDIEIRFQADLIAYYKKVIFEFENATQESIVTDSGTIRYRVNFDEKKGTIRVFGYTLTNPPEAYAEVERDPLKLSLEVRREGNNFYTAVVWQSDTSLVIDSLNVKYSGFEEKKRSFFGYSYSIGYESSLDNFADVNLDKLNIGIGPRLGSYIFLSSVGIPEDFNLKKTRVRICIQRVF